MENIFIIRAVTQCEETSNWFECVHRIRAAEEEIAVSWVRKHYDGMNRRIELWRVEDVQAVPHFGKANTDD